jgi:hypothetical protein
VTLTGGPLLARLAPLLPAGALLAHLGRSSAILLEESAKTVVAEDAEPGELVMVGDPTSRAPVKLLRPPARPGTCGVARCPYRLAPCDAEVDV